MTQTPHPFDVLDTAPLVCLLDSAPDVVYGPYTPAEAMDFCEKWNTFFGERNLPGTWKAAPLVRK